MDAKKALDRIIDIARVHFYKPIQIAEILHHDRTQPGNIDITSLETYRSISKKWRDAISQRLVGSISTSSSRYQDNVFDKNAMPPHHLAELAEVNRQENGIVECYIYHRMGQKWGDLLESHNYLLNSTVSSFNLSHFLAFFERSTGLTRSVDKAYEIIVYSLFSTLVHALNATITLSLENPDPQIMRDFNSFIQQVLGLSTEQPRQTLSAQLYRAGVTNAADRGLDMWTNYGPVVQVKHLRLDRQLAESMSDELPTSSMIIVCKTADADLIQSLLSQLGLRIRGIITQDDLENWYHLCQTTYHNTLGEKLLVNLRREFKQEFPQLVEFEHFLKERGYSPDNLTGIWQV
ncbi:MAG: HaeII family restriction endonuclease [Phototrophicales bacterium]